MWHHCLLHIDSSLTVFTTGVSHKIGWQVGGLVLLPLFPPLSFGLQLQVPLLLAPFVSLTNDTMPVSVVDAYQFLAVWVNVSQLYVTFAEIAQKRSIGRPVGWCPMANSRYRRSLGMRPSSIQRTCPSHRSRRWQSIRHMLRDHALNNVGDHVMLRIQWRQRRWKLSRRFCCLVYVDQDSLSYSKVSTVSVTP